MLRHKHMDRLCIAAMALALCLALCFTALALEGKIAPHGRATYESKIFDQSKVHTIDIQMADWDAFIDTCENEEYALCTVVIDGETFGSVAIRAKGNTSLSQVSSYGNDRYSFKVEFDHYDDALTYYGLDKLSLNNLIQDKTLMKDYLSYTLMGKMGVASPLCSYVKLSVNGEYFGLYLAAEGVEDAFLARNFASSQGELYKPDSMSFGGGRGNGRDFDMDAFREQMEQTETDGTQPDMPAVPGGRGQIDQQRKGNFGSGRMMGGEKGSFGNEASDVKLQYIDDQVDSYANIFENAKTDLTYEDQQRLIASIKRLSQGDEAVVNRDKVLRYFAVHNFLCNGDSYTGQMVHNYYLYEQNGVLEMIPWDYNLAIGAFSMGASGAESAVNEPIDYELADRPMAAWIFDDAESLDAYHKVYLELVETYLESGWLTQEIERVGAMLAPYAEEDPTAFFDAEQVRTAQSMLIQFVNARTESIRGQLDGIIPATRSTQRMAGDTLVDASHIDLNAMGEFGMGGGGNMGDRNFGNFFPGGMELPEGFDPGQMGAPPGGMELPEGFDPGQMGAPPGGMELPEGFDPSQMGAPPGGMELPEGFDPSQMGVPPGAPL